MVVCRQILNQEKGTSFGHDDKFRKKKGNTIKFRFCYWESAGISAQREESGYSLSGIVSANQRGDWEIREREYSR